MSNRSGTSFRLSQEARRLIERLAVKLGVSKTSVVEIAVRKLAEEEHVESAQNQG